MKNKNVNQTGSENSAETAEISSSPCYSGLNLKDVDPNYLMHTSNQPMLNIKSSNTIIYCKNWNACQRFYSEVFKLEIRFQKDDWFIEYQLRNGACLSIADETRCTIEPALGKGLTLSFFVDNLEELHRYFEQQKVDVTPIKTNSWRAPFFFAKDPDGNRIEFWTEGLN